VELPTTYNYTVGIQALADIGLYILTTTTLYSIPSAGVINSVLDVTSWKLNENAILTSNFWDPYLHIVQDNMIYSINLTNPSTPLVSSVKSDLNQVIDLEVYLSYVDSVETPTLLAIQNYTLYLLDATLGTAKILLTVPKGPGSPRVNAYGPDTFFFCDDASIYSIDVPNGKLLTTNPFTLGPYLQGFFQWHP